MIKEDYISSIVEKLHKCNDLSLLYLIDQLLDKSIQEMA